MTGLKAFVETLKGKPVAVFGMGITGLSVVKALKKAGAKIVAGDDHPESVETLKKLNIEILGNIEDRDFSKFAFLLLSPGVPLTHPQPHPVVSAAQEAGIEVIGDVELWHRCYPDVKTIGITGTNGKSTTTSLTHHILKEGGLKTVFGGNIGNPVFEMKVPAKEGVVVLELSSFQIDLCPEFRPDIAILLNLTPDHIDRHGTMENYAAVKARLLEGTKGERTLTGIIDVEDTLTQKIYEAALETGARRLLPVSTAKVLESGIYVQEGVLYDATGEGILKVGDLEEIKSLKGLHNHQNAACAYAAARAAGMAPLDIFAAMQSYPGLQHRQFLVRTINGVAYVNDSKATNAAASAMALACRQNIYWIVGGRKKETGLDGLEIFASNIKHAFLIGESSEDFAKWFETYGVDFTRCFTLENAILKAHAIAQENRGQPGGAGSVLLSPACASFDQYKNFEHRGDHFTDLVEKLTEEVPG
ncbi:MAG: UDP-N-acetylmuramoyl-L-alanine--D-glutamate ligase [Alphaproteobacteria bacterium]|nr:UDP-N-acetylmuramoyl-L-alanine--D-glutamate ligase [Alphaproteobacteria bacterium]